MFYRQDYIMRQIEGIGLILAQLLLHRSGKDGQAEIREDTTLGEALTRELLDMVDAGDLNGAENLLHERVEAQPNRGNLAAALAFYERLGRMDDDELESRGFSREEILEGLQAIQQHYILMEGDGDT